MQKNTLGVLRLVDYASVLIAADFSRIRNADLGRFTVYRLMSSINRLGSRVEVRVRVRRVETVAQEARP